MLRYHGGILTSIFHIIFPLTNWHSNNLHNLYQSILACVNDSNGGVKIIYLWWFVHGKIWRQSSLAGEWSLPGTLWVPLSESGVHASQFLLFTWFSRQLSVLGDIIQTWQVKGSPTRSLGTWWLHNLGYLSSLCSRTRYLIHKVTVLFAWAVLRLHCKWVCASASTWPDCGNHFPPCPVPGPLQWRAAVSPSCVCSSRPAVPARSHCPAPTMLTIQLSRQPVKGTELF